MKELYCTLTNLRGLLVQWTIRPFQIKYLFLIPNRPISMRVGGILVCHGRQYHKFLWEIVILRDIKLMRYTFVCSSTLQMHAGGNQGGMRNYYLIWSGLTPETLAASSGTLLFKIFMPRYHRCQVSGNVRDLELLSRFPHGTYFLAHMSRNWAT